MKTIIADSRGVPLSVTMLAIAACPWTITEVISGTARGPDTHGEEWAAQCGVPVVRMPADWKRGGRGAGLARNVDMAKASEALLAVWDGRSRGTRHMIDTAREMGLKVHVHMIDKPPPSTQLEHLAAIFDAMPGDTATWLDLAKRLDTLRRHSDPTYRGPERDDSIDYITWAHLRNISRVVGEMARGFAAMERGDDPDIPF